MTPGPMSTSRTSGTMLYVWRSGSGLLLVGTTSCSARGAPSFGTWPLPTPRRPGSSGRWSGSSEGWGRMMRTSRSPSPASKEPRRRSRRSWPRWHWFRPRTLGPSPSSRARSRNWRPRSPSGMPRRRPRRSQLWRSSPRSSPRRSRGVSSDLEMLQDWSSGRSLVVTSLA